MILSRLILLEVNSEERVRVYGRAEHSRNTHEHISKA